MNKLVTKSTHKRKNYNKKYLANKLDHLAKKVAKRNIFVVEKTEPGYNIINYLDKSVVVENIPFLSIAQTAAKNFNKSENDINGNTARSMQSHVDKYFKHYMDLQFYKHTIKTSEDKTKVFTAGVRMQDSLFFIKEAKRHLAYF